MVSVTLTSCLSFFPNRYEKTLVYNGFRANTNTGIGTKVNIKGYYSLANDSTKSAPVGSIPSLAMVACRRLQDIILLSFMRTEHTETFSSRPVWAVSLTMSTSGHML